MEKNLIQIFQIAQPTTALARNVTLYTGWRPGLVLVINYAAGKRWAIAADTGLAAPAGGLKMDSSSVASAAVGSDGVSFLDNGIKIGQDADIMTEGDANILVVIFRASIVKLTLAEAAGIAAFGKGKQFGAGTEDGSDSARKIGEPGTFSTSTT